MDKFKYIAVVLLFSPFSLLAQLERKLVDEDRVEELTFHAPRNINLLTVEPLSKQDLHWSIMHTFSTLDNGARSLWGIDNGVNVRFSLEYGITDRLSVGIGRSSRDKVYDALLRYHILQQTRSGSMPVSVSAAVVGGWNTVKYEFLGDDAPEFNQRTSFAAQIMIARKFTDRISFQISPMMAYFSDMQSIYLTEGEEDLYFALAFSGKVKVSSRASVTAQYIPNLNNPLNHNFGFGVDLEAGGHVFQMYMVTSPFLNEMYLLAGGNGTPGEQFRLGFNVNRIFGIGKKK